MKKKVFVTAADTLPYAASFDPHRFVSVPKAYQADIICIGGGHDIHPAVYGAHFNGAFDCEPEDDLADWHLVHKWSGIKPLVGICRGFQLLAVLDGFGLCQHNDEHVNLSDPHTLNNGYKVPSSHHQTIHIADPLSARDAQYNIYKVDDVVESIWCRDKGYFGVQWHPYSVPSNHWAYTYFNNSVEELVG